MVIVPPDMSDEELDNGEAAGILEVPEPDDLQPQVSISDSINWNKNEFKDTMPSPSPLSPVYNEFSLLENKSPAELFKLFYDDEIK